MPRNLNRKIEIPDNEFETVSKRKTCRQLFETESGRLVVCDMRPGFTEDQVRCKIPPGQYHVTYEKDFSLHWCGVSLMMENSIASHTKFLGELSLDMATIGIYDSKVVDAKFKNNGEAAFDWSGEILGNSNRKDLQFHFDREKRVRFLSIQADEDCTCQVHAIYDGSRQVGIRISKKLPDTKIDLLADKRKITDYLKERIAEYSVYVNVGLGNDDDPISKATIAFDLKRGYLALVFDTRPGLNLESDVSEKHVRDGINQLEMPIWKQASFEMECGRQILLIRENRIAWRMSNDIGSLIGFMIEDVTEQMRKQKQFIRLPLTKKAHLVVTEIDGDYRWPQKSKKRVNLN